MNLIRKWTQTSLVLRILAGLVLGLVLGLLVPDWHAIGIPGVIFVGALKALAPVLVALLVMSSIARAHRGNGPRFRLVIGLYLLTTLTAALVAVSASFIWPVPLTLTEMTSGEAPGSLAEIFSSLLANMVKNPLSSIASANYIGILFWAVVFGLALRMAGSETTIRVVGDFANATSRIITWVIQFAPFGILGLVYTAVSGSGLEIFTTYGKVLLLLVGCMLFVVLAVNPLVHFVLLRRNPYPLLFVCLRESGLNAFFTRSSAANIPINLDLCKKLGVDEEFYSVSIPLGATINMNGAAVTITVLSLAAAHTVGTEVSFLSALMLSVIATLGACGASGVAGGSLLLIPMACSFFGISPEVAMQAVAVGFILGVVQDSMETALNSSSDAFFTVTADRYQKNRQAGGS